MIGWVFLLILCGLGFIVIALLYRDCRRDLERYNELMMEFWKKKK